jgi:hypothetical protein
MIIGSQGRGVSASRVTASRFSLRFLLLAVTLAATACWLYNTSPTFGPLFAWLFLGSCLFVIGLYTRSGGLTLLAAAVMLTLSVLGPAIVVMGGHPVSVQRLSRVRLGSTAEEVHALLGPPSQIDFRWNGQAWIYAGPTFCHVTIRFAPDATVIEVIHDH